MAETQQVTRQHWSLKDEPLSVIEVVTIIALGSEGDLLYASDALGVLFDVSKARRYVRNEPRMIHHCPTAFAPDTDLDPDNVARANLREPGIVVCYFGDDDLPIFDLIDGNHRYAKAHRLRLPWITVYALTPHEARMCEIVLFGDTCPPRRRYRHIEDGG